MHVLRFDYLGTGDSAGEVCDVVLEDWLENICQAVDELKETTGLRTIGLVGLRFGSALAALAAQTRSDVDRLVLWDPIADGHEYLDTLATWRDAGADGRTVVRDNRLEVEGDTYAAALTAGIRRVSPERYGSGLPVTLIVSTVPDDHAHETLARSLADGGSKCSSQRHPGPSVWVNAQVNVGMPVKAMGMISQWMSEKTLS